MSRLDYPSVKLRIADLQKATENTRIDELRRWKVSNPVNERDFVVVWLQGKITAIDKDSDYLILNDDGAECKIELISQSPVGSKPLQVGGYIMVIGDVIRAGRHETVVRTMKLQDLSSVSIAEKMWKSEVEDFQKNS